MAIVLAKNSESYPGLICPPSLLLRLQYPIEMLMVKKKKWKNFGIADTKHLLWLKDQRHPDCIQELLSSEGLSLAAAATESLESESDLINLSLWL